MDETIMRFGLIGAATALVATRIIMHYKQKNDILKERKLMLQQLKRTTNNK